jgi:hypothetical protein
MLMVCRLIVDRPQFIGLHSQITLRAPHRLFRPYSHAFPFALGDLRRGSLSVKSTRQGLTIPIVIPPFVKEAKADSI